MKNIIFEALTILAMLATISFFVLSGLCFVFGVVSFTETVANVLAVLAGIPLVSIIAASKIENF